MRIPIRLVSGLLVLVVLLVLPVGAQAKSGPVLAFAPQTGGSFDYGIVAVGSHKDQVFTLKNTGSSASGVIKISLTGSSAFSIPGGTCSGASLGPSKTCTVTARYTGTSGTATATLTSMSTKPAAAASVILNGTGGAADVVINPTSYDFGSTSGSQTFTATNDGNISTGTYTFNPPADAHFGLTGANSCTGAALAPNGSCSFTVAFTAPATCAVEPALYLDSASLGTYASATLKGQEPLCVPHLTVSPYDPAVGVVGTYGDPYWDFFGDSGSEVFSLTNDGDAATGVLSFSYHDKPTGDPNQWLLLDLGSCQDVTTLAVGASCTFEITFDDSDQSLCLFEGVTVATNYLTISDASYAQDGSDPGFTGSCPGLFD